MSAKKGSLFLIKRGDGEVSEAFTTMAALKTKSARFNAETVDVTHSDSPAKWRALLEGAGIRSLAVAGSGVFENEATAAAARADFFNHVHRNYQVIIPDFGTVQGSFQITTLEYAGEHNGEVTWDFALESAGEITFTAL